MPDGVLRGRSIAATGRLRSVSLETSPGTGFGVDGQKAALVLRATRPLKA